MGYNTDFSGSFTVTPKLTKKHAAYLQAFADTRRVKRNPAATELLPDPLRLAVGLPVGPDGDYFVGSPESVDWDPDILDHNAPPSGQPGLWCQWVPTTDGKAIEWDEGEKFYEYVDWLRYLIDNFLRPWGYKLNGDVTWAGEEPDDLGHMIVRDNQLSVFEGHIEYTENS
jgi:hypothetical protein